MACPCVQDLPEFLRQELSVTVDQRSKLVHHIMDALSRHSEAPSLDA